jgi:wyosine [tRNA(Phe)-imidazoG37] synthetase (radical SAM superfamily)
MIKKFVYGPVPSRRLGLSLGINLVPKKTCSFNCVYCQCGRTTNLTITRETWFPVEAIINQVRSAVHKKMVDYLTFSGEGEPTLNKNIGTIIRLLKKEFRIPVAVITNSSLLSTPEVRRALYPADLVIPTLSCADEPTFRRLHRPHHLLKIENIIKGLKIFRQHYHGKLWIEVMLVKGINDTPEHLVRLRKVIYNLRPDRVHLNTVVRPPAESYARPLSLDDLLQIQLLFGPGTEIAISSAKTAQKKFSGDPEPAVLAVLRNRPVTANDLIQALGIPPGVLNRTICQLLSQGKITKKYYQGKYFYQPA